MAVLKQATHAMHRQLDQSSSMARLMARDLRPAEYVHVLQTLQGIYAVIEPRMQAAEQRVGKLLDWDCKADWLASDLLHLQAPQRQSEALSDSMHLSDGGILPTIISQAQLAGCLYVLEGSTLGGRIIADRLRSNTGVQAAGALRFFSAYGDATYLRWATCGAAINACLASEALRLEACAAARAVFGLFIARCRGQAPSLPGALPDAVADAQLSHARM